jgi:UDP-GlcNAc:undecaprenyl-phosphate/decaprenyl-phosphate GlcNAc-1-phosphate transferase
MGLLIALALAPSIIRGLAAGGHVRPNYRRRALPFPLGILIIAAGVVTLIPLELAQQLSASSIFYPQLSIVLPYALGVGLLGLIDDNYSDSSRGWRGHAASTLAGRFSTGALKGAGSLGLALYVMSGQGLSTGRYLLAVAVLVLATNTFNLLDLRPGRCLKALGLLGAGLCLGTMSVRALWAVGVLASPALIAGVYDLRERAMLGDTGANLMGALAGLWIVLSFSGTGQLVALAVLLLITIYGEFRSISGFVERTPGLRELDSWGRPS